MLQNINMLIISTSFYNFNQSLLYFEFLPILIFLGIAIVLALIIVTLSYVLSVQNPDTEKLSTTSVASNLMRIPEIFSM